MQVSELRRQRILVNARGLVAKLSRFRSVFTVSSLGYCAIHLLVAHDFSRYVFLGALAFGVVATMAVAWLADWYSSSWT